ncbi:hypothetical protein EVA_10535 [gut metagenome]|uniref:Uncharacterized protein n=1 Tax=gut metagenome TaxID=749906 RepID=J9GN84_9ZZZZ
MQLLFKNFKQTQEKYRNAESAGWRAPAKAVQCKVPSTEVLSSYGHRM